MNVQLALVLTLSSATAVVACSYSTTSEPVETGESSSTVDAATTLSDASQAHDAASSDASTFDASDAAEAGPSGPLPFTKAEVQELVEEHCTGCHSGAFAPQGMSLAVDFAAATVGIPSNQAPGLLRIAPGKRDKSYLFHKVSGTHLTVGGAGARMPRGGPYLGDLEIERLGLFIDGL